MIYQCNECKKIYSREEILDNQYYRISKKGIIPICPNCKSEDFKVMDLVRKN